MCARSGRAFVEGKPFGMSTQEKFDAYRLCAHRNGRMSTRKAVQDDEKEEDKETGLSGYRG